MHRIKILLGVVLLLLVATATLGVEPGGKSYLDIANSAYMDKDYAKSAEYYQKWVEAQPTDNTAWYNWACALALNGKPEDAAKALLGAVQAGWTDRSHTEKDTDLDTIRDQADYQKALELIDEMVAKKKANKFGVPYLAPQTKLSSYWIRVPADFNPEKPYPLVILLHGRGGNGEQFLKVANKLDTLHFVYAAPQAPYYIDDTQNGFQYFPRVAQGDSASYWQAAQLTADWIVSCAHAVGKYCKIDSNKFWVIGFSQGGAMAHLMGLLCPNDVAGYAACGGYLMKDFATSERLQKMKKKGVKVFIGHGTEDQVVTPDEAQTARETLTSKGIDLSFHTYAAGHTLPDSMRQDLTVWLQQCALK
jgi:phospholipase/carboxylesterase